MWFWLTFLFRLKCWSVIQSKDQNINFMLLKFLLDSYRNNKGTLPVTLLSSMTFSRFSKSCLGVAFFFTALRSRCRTECLSSDSRGLELLSTSRCCPIKDSSIAEICTQATPHNIKDSQEMHTGARCTNCGWKFHCVPDERSLLTAKGDKTTFNEIVACVRFLYQREF